MVNPTQGLINQEWSVELYVPSTYVAGGITLASVLKGEVDEAYVIGAMGTVVGSVSPTSFLTTAHKDTGTTGLGAVIGTMPPNQFIVRMFQSVGTTISGLQELPAGTLGQYTLVVLERGH